MPKAPSYTVEQLTDRALAQFWARGFHATSMDELVTATGVSRQGIYSAFGGKRDLFLACFDRYRETIVTPAFAAIERPDADFTQIAEYFEYHIARGEAAGLPGPGCFVANAATETAPVDDGVMEKVRGHNDRLLRGFANAVRNGVPARVSDDDVDLLARTLVIFTNGLWSASRTVTDGDTLRACVRTFLETLQGGKT